MFEPRLFQSQFSQLWKINLWAIILTVSYVLFRVVPFHKPELLIFFGIVIHSALIVRKQCKYSDVRENSLGLEGFTREQVWWQTLLASLASASLICGVALSLMLLNVRSWVQEHWFGNPYFPISATKELWMPLMWMFSYLLVIPLIHYAVVRPRQPWRDPNSGWATMVVGLGLFGWYTLKMAAGTCSAGELGLFAVCHVPAAIVLIFANWRIHRSMELSS